MTQFGQTLANLKNTLEAQQTQYFNERWALIKAEDLTTFRQKKEQECADAISMLQSQRDAAIQEKEEQLRKALQTEVDAKFGQAKTQLETMQNLFNE